MKDDILGISGKKVIKDGEPIPEGLQPSNEKTAEIIDPDFELKKKVIAELEKGEVTTLSGVAGRLGVSKLKLWALKRKDTAFAEQINEAGDVLADRFEEELLTVDKMPQVIARLARLKVLRPAYRDSFKVVVGSPKVEAYLEELRQAAHAKSPRELKEAGKAVALLDSGEVSAE